MTIGKIASKIGMFVILSFLDTLRFTDLGLRPLAILVLAF